MAKRVAKMQRPTEGGAAGLDPSSVTVDQLADLINRDRLARLLSWPKYAEFMGIPQATVYKISRKARNRKGPHQTTIARILQVITDNPMTAHGVRTRGEASDGDRKKPMAGTD